MGTVQEFSETKLRKKGQWEGSEYAVEVEDLDQSLGLFEWYQGTCFKKYSGKNSVDAFSYLKCEFGQDRESSAKTSSRIRQMPKNIFGCTAKIKYLPTERGTFILYLRKNMLIFRTSKR